jgi:hypothetical protein
MTDERATDRTEAPPGCGVQGCLAAAVALFVILLIGMAIVAAIRFSSPPQPRFGSTAEPRGIAVSSLAYPHRSGAPARPAGSPRHV